MNLPVTSKKYPGLVCIIDDYDYELIKEYKLNACKKSKDANNFYVNLVRKSERIAIHRFLMNAPIGLEVDHINRNPLDNRRVNLRIATQVQNSYNKFQKKTEKSTSAFKGVYWATDKNMWAARIHVNGKGKSIGYFKCEVDAAFEYNKEAVKFFGEFACLNTFTEEQIAGRLNEPRWDRQRSVSKYKGVYLLGNRYVAHIKKNGKKVHIGCYKTEDEAGAAFNKEALAFFGEGTYLNKIETNTCRSV